jgi:hypothetical protein
MPCSKTALPHHVAGCAPPLPRGLGSKRLEVLAEEKVGVVVLLQLGGLHRQCVLPLGGIRHIPQLLACMQRALGGKKLSGLVRMRWSSWRVCFVPIHASSLQHLRLLTCKCTAADSAGRRFCGTKALAPELHLNLRPTETAASARETDILVKGGTRSPTPSRQFASCGRPGRPRRPAAPPP